MQMVNFRFVNRAMDAADKNLLWPQKKSDLASGFDLASAHKVNLTLRPQERLLVNTGVAVSLDPGFEGQVRSRSGLALQFGVVVLNSPGTIDADYRGEIKVILANFSSDTFTITFGMRIAQLVILPISMVFLHEVASLDESERGEKGFGSTGY